LAPSNWEILGIMATSEGLIDELRREIVRLRGALEYWLSDEASVSPEDHPTWQRHVALIVEDTPEAEISAEHPVLA
jgi:hypothetical protein